MHDNFTHKVKVYYEDTDAGGVVYYANYLNFLERARTEAITSIGLSVTSSNINYKMPAKLEDELSIRSFIKSITKTSFFMNQIITRGNDVIVEAQIHLVFVNKLGKPTRIPNILFNEFKPYFCDSIKK
jgi:acyl-CoA thioester hydrolase